MREQEKLVVQSAIENAIWCIDDLEMEFSETGKFDTTYAEETMRELFQAKSVMSTSYAGFLPPH